MKDAASDVDLFILVSCEDKYESDVNEAFKPLGLSESVAFSKFSLMALLCDIIPALLFMYFYLLHCSSTYSEHFILLSVIFHSP